MLTATLAKLLNRGLPRSLRARELVAQLSGKRLAVVVPHIARVTLASDGVTLSVEQDELPADATLRGGIVSLLGLMGPGGEALIQRGAVAFEGDTQVAEKFRELLELLRPDFEEELSLVLGDVPAHQLGRLAQRAGAFGRRAADTTLTNLAEYLAHERSDLVSRNEGEQFLRGVDGVREAADRLQARLDLLLRRRGVS
jgi:ubiquinone biosynthesis accessory factor UbiJ